MMKKYLKTKRKILLLILNNLHNITILNINALWNKQQNKAYALAWHLMNDIS